MRQRFPAIDGIFRLLVFSLLYGGRCC